MNNYSGIVQKGTKRAEALGFPTVNIPLDDKNVSGVYVAQVFFDGEKYPAAAFADEKRKILEAHIVDVDLALYGKSITIELLKKIRDSRSFENDEELRGAIAADSEAAFRQQPFG